MPIRLSDEEVMAKIMHALQKTKGHLGAALKTAGVSRTLYRRLRDEYPEFHQQIKDKEKELVDYVEDKLLQLIEENDFRAIKFFLERIDKERWGESVRQEIVHESPIDIRGSLEDLRNTLINNEQDPENRA